MPNEEDLLVKELRDKPENVRRSFMVAEELKRLRMVIFRITQEQLARQLINPSTGAHISTNLVSKWECSLRPVPLWAARKVRLLAEATKKHDAKKGLE